MSFKAVIIDKKDDKYDVKLGTFDEAQLTEGDTVIRVAYSSLNYKDGLAVTNKAPVVRRFPMIPGVDLAGTVEETSASDLSVGDRVILNGWGTGETHLGAWAEKSRVWAKWLIPAPAGFTLKQTMAIGTAGYTAALCVLELQHAGVSPEQGPILVSGAAGGVGSIAVALLASLGFQVTASTGRPEEAEYLQELGASEIIKRDELTGAPRALSKERWAAAVDSVGSSTLANILSMTKYGGSVACCGLAGGMDLPSSVAPFILRGVRLIGVDSVMAPREKRLQAWDLLDRVLDRRLLDKLTTTIPLDKIIPLGQEIVQGKTRGRIVVRIAEE